MADGLFIVTDNGIVPTIDEVQVPNLQWISNFTVNPATDIFTTSVPHTQLAGEVIMFSSSGTLPAPLMTYVEYRVLTVNLGTNTFSVCTNAAWNPSPEPPPLDITDTGTGVHSLWIRSLDFVGTVEGSSGAGYPGPNYLTGEDIGGYGAIYIGNAARHQYKNISSMGGLHTSTDYWTGGYGQVPTKWQARVGGSGGTTVSLLGSGQADLWAYGYPAVMEWGLGELGVLGIGGGGDQYYSLCGDCTFGGGGGGGGAAGGGGEDPVVLRIARPTIRVRDPETAGLIRRARAAVRAIENMSITGEGFSGDINSGFMYNSDVDDA